MRVRKWVFGFSILVVAGCGKPSSEVTIESVRQDARPLPAVKPVTSAERFGYSRLQQPSHGGNMEASASDSAAEDLHWTGPKTWIKGPARSMRLVTYFLDEAESAECYVTVLPGAAGGTAANLNRWCGQMGHAALDEAGISALPRISCLGQEAPLLVLEGTYSGMGGSAQADSLFAGIAVQSSGKTVFVKMVGPKSVVAPQLEAFNLFCASLHEPSSHTGGHSHE